MSSEPYVASEETHPIQSAADAPTLPEGGYDATSEEGDEAVDATGEPTGDAVEVAPAPPVASATCEACGKTFPRLEVNKGKCAPCQSAADDASIVDLSAPAGTQLRQLAGIVAALVHDVEELKGAVNG